MGEETVDASSALTWSAPVVKRGGGCFSQRYTSVKLKEEAKVICGNMIIS